MLPVLLILLILSLPLHSPTKFFLNHTTPSPSSIPFPFPIRLMFKFIYSAAIGPFYPRPITSIPLTMPVLPRATHTPLHRLDHDPVAQPHTQSVDIHLPDMSGLPTSIMEPYPLASSPDPLCHPFTLPLWVQSAYMQNPALGRRFMHDASDKALL